MLRSPLQSYTAVSVVGNNLPNTAARLSAVSQEVQTVNRKQETVNFTTATIAAQLQHTRKANTNQS